MRRQRHRSAAFHRASAKSWRQAFAALALVLFAVQNYVTQTHVHLLGRGTPDILAPVGLAQAQPAPAPGKNRPADTPANCPICQDIALAGHFTSPGAIALPPPAFVAIPSLLVLVLPAFVSVASHDWQGRAPPRR